MRLESLPILLTAAGLVAQDHAPPSYNSDVRPILADHCFRCHGPDAKARKAGLRLDQREVATAPLPSGQTAIVPGAPDRSALLARVLHVDVAERMPPAAVKKPLSTAEIATLRAWIQHGAAYEPHWSFVPPAPRQPPAVHALGWPRNDVDRFVLTRLEQLGQQPSVEADRATWLRRVTHDLTGLPPTIAALDAFLADAGSAAYERAVDALLQTSSHAEHMARHWCDVARYGDTHGYHLDNERALWLWRDWVIAAYASNMPFDRFTIEQLAGDLLPEATPAQQIASGFHRNGCTTGEGGIIDEEYLVKYAAERVAVTGTVWLGLSLGCAQCHDHKFDPISQKEFYQLFDFFHSIAENGSDENVRAPPPQRPFPTPAQQRQLADLDGRIAALRQRTDAPEPQLDAAQAAWEQQLLADDGARWQVLVPTSANATGGTVLVQAADHSLLATGAQPAQDVYTIEAGTDLRAIRALRIEALRTADGQGPGRFAGNGNFVLTGIELVAAPKDGSSEAKPVAITAAYADYCQRNFPIGLALDGDPRSGWGVDGARHEHAAVLCFAPLDFAAGTQLRLTLRFESQFAAHAFARCRLAVSADPATAPLRTDAWHQKGPFPGPVAAVFGTDYGPEAGNGSETVDAGAGWTPMPAFVDDQVHALSPGIGADYLRRTIDAPDARLVRFALGSGDGLKVWLNGRLLLAHDVTRAAAPDQEQLEAWLRKGANDLLLKVCHAGSGHAFCYRTVGEASSGAPPEVLAALRTATAERSTEQQHLLRRHYRRHFTTDGRQLAETLHALEEQRAALMAAVPNSMVMAERSERRTTWVRIRGQYDRHGEPVTADVPAFLPPLPAAAPHDRLALARWLVDGRNPLTARVTVNRLWQMLFGVGLVRTAADFGTQGEWPSHPELLDWLASEFVRSGWDLRHVLRLCVLSATYRQASSAPPVAFASDPADRLLARAPRFRLDAEQVRDQALAIAGLLQDQVGGPSARTYQPPGIWEAAGYPTSTTVRFVQDHGPALWRRSMYTFWKRTAPHPAMTAFDAPSRESCTVSRARTNTPLQALVTWNDVQFVECARAFAARMLHAGGDGDVARLAFGFRCCTAHAPDAGDLEVLTALLQRQRARYTSDPAAAAALLAVGESPLAGDLAAPELAAFTVVASVLLNLDATLTRD